MSLVKRGNSRFWYVQFQLEHRTIIRSTKTTDKKVAEQVAAQIRAQAHEQFVLGRKKIITLELALERFIRSKAHTPNYRTLLSNSRTLNKILRRTTPLADIDQAAVEQFVQRRLEQGIHPQTIKHGLNCLLGAIKKARKEGYETCDIEMPTIRIPKRMVRYLSADEERRLLDELNPYRSGNGLPSLDKDNPTRDQWMVDNYDLIVILIDTGARYSEIANIRWAQIDLGERTIRLWRNKVQNESILYMTDRVTDILRRRWKDRRTEFVFSNKSGGPRGYSAVGIRKAFKRAGLDDCTIHTLRHTHASRLVQNGMNVYEVRAVLGHADIKTTMRYAHLEQTAVTAKARDTVNKLNGQLMITDGQGNP